MSRFVRGFVFMRYLNLSDLGVVTLVSTIMGLFTMLQIGLLNGGYRIFSVDNPNKWKVNDTIYSYFFSLEIIIVFGTFLTFLLDKITANQLIFALLAAFFGLILVLNNWNRNMLIAQQKLKEVNRLEFIATFLSFILLFTVIYIKIYGALLVIFSREFIFYILTITRNKTFLPRQFSFTLREIKWILSFGFLPFLSGVLIQMSMQVETWSIFSFLSTEALGKFYLPKLYISLFMIIPVAVGKLYFPETMKAFVKGNFYKVKKTIISFVVINAGFCVFAVILTLLLLDFVIGFIIPKHLVGIPYIWIILPGLIISTLVQPISLIFYAAVKLYPFLWSSGAALVFTASSLSILGIMGVFTLDYVAIVKSLSYIIISFVLLIIFLSNRNSVWKVNISKEKMPSQ